MPAEITETVAIAPATYASSFESARAEIVVFPDEKLVPINLDVLRAVTTALGAGPAIHTYRGTLRALPLLDQERIDRVDTYAKAAAFAHSCWFAATTPPPPVTTQLTVCATHRESLLLAADALTVRGLLSADRVRAIRQSAGQRECASGVIGLVEMFHAAWATVGTHTAVTLDELTAATAAAEALLAAIAVRDAHATTLTEWSDLRHRAVSLFVTTYDQIRRGVSFIRWNEGDVNEIIPTLFIRDGAGAHKDPVVTPVTATATNSTSTTAASKPSTPAATLAAMTAPADTAHATVPQSDPFGRST